MVSLKQKVESVETKKLGGDGISWIYVVREFASFRSFRTVRFSLTSVSPGQTTANNSKTTFSLHVVESASDDYNF